MFDMVLNQPLRDVLKAPLQEFISSTGQNQQPGNSVK